MSFACCYHLDAVRLQIVNFVKLTTLQKQFTSIYRKERKKINFWKKCDFLQKNLFLQKNKFSQQQIRFFGKKCYFYSKKGLSRQKTYFLGKIRFLWQKGDFMQKYK